MRNVDRTPVEVDPLIDKLNELNNLGVQRMLADDFYNADSLYRAALDLDPMFYPATINLGVSAGRQKQWDVGAVMFQRAVTLCPHGDPKPWTNLAMHLYMLQRYDEADDALKRAARCLGRLSDDTDLISYHTNRGLCSYMMGNYGSAIIELERSIALHDKNGRSPIDRYTDLSYAVMRSGRLHDGLVINEHRWDQGGLVKQAGWSLGLPKWQGELLIGKTILVHAEQGFGDTIQWMRYIRCLVERGANVIFAVQTPLVRLLEGSSSCPVIDMHDIGAMAQAARVADYHCPLLSVVQELGVEFDGASPEDNAPYLRPVLHIAHRAQDLIKGKALHVGLVWAASPGHQRSRERSVPIEQIIELAEVPGVKLYSLQKGPFSDDPQKMGVQSLITDLTGQINDFGDTSELMTRLDLVIAVDTGPMHIAAAMGIKTWLIQPYVPCWRWTRGAKRWYASVDEFFQIKPLSWKEPIAEMKQRLLTMTKERSWR